MTPRLPQNADALIERFTDVDPSVKRFYRGVLDRLAIPYGEDYLALISAALHRRGENLLALLVIDRGCDEATLLSSVDDAGTRIVLLTRIKVLHALHSYERARALAEAAIAQRTIPDVELIGNLASITKSQALASQDEVARETLLRASMQLYAMVFSEPAFRGSYWLGVNALALAVCLRETELVNTHLGVVRRDCEMALEANAQPDFWVLATVAEIELIAYISAGTQSADEAEQLLSAYRRADAACHTLQQRKSARKNLGLLMSSLAQVDAALSAWLMGQINQCLRPAEVVVFSGHRIDSPGRDGKRFPLDRVPAFSAALDAKLMQSAVDVGYASAANGGDLLFLQGLQQRKAQVNVVLPFDAEQFAQLSVGPDMAAPQCDWATQYRKLIDGQSADAVVWHAGFSEVDPAMADACFAHANQVLLGLARLKAREIDGQLSGWVLAETSEGASDVGALAAGRQWADNGLQVHAYVPSTDRWCALTPQAARPAEHADEEGDVVVNRTMLFADVVGFSRFGEQAMAGFCDGFLCCVRELLDEGGFSLAEINTWGDGLFMVFPSASAAAECALRLCEVMESRNATDQWRTYGLPATMALRVSLHSSPVRRFRNPLTGVNSHWGHNVNVAARIEPITPPNQVYGSVSTAALLAAESDGLFKSDFVGMVPLAKNFGAMEIFRIWRGD